MARAVRSTAVKPKLLSRAKLSAYHKSGAVNDLNNAIIKESKTVILNE